MNNADLMKNELAEEDQVRMNIWDILLNLVKRLQMMNPKTFKHLYNGLQAIENEKKQTIKSIRNEELPNWGQAIRKH